ncbi:MAG: hypothetical protein ABIG67_05800 [Pseudomonadota bacterium]
MKFGKAIPYDIRIKATANMGFDVHVGCCHVVFIEAIDMLDALAVYIRNPKGMEREYNEACGGCLAGMELPDQPMPPGTVDSTGRILGANH